MSQNSEGLPIILHRQKCLRCVLSEIDTNYHAELLELLPSRLIIIPKEKMPPPRPGLNPRLLGSEPSTITTGPQCQMERGQLNSFTSVKPEKVHSMRNQAILVVRQSAVAGEIARLARHPLWRVAAVSRKQEHDRRDGR